MNIHRIYIFLVTGETTTEKTDLVVVVVIQCKKEEREVGKVVGNDSLNTRVDNELVDFLGCLCKLKMRQSKEKQREKFLWQKKRK